MNFLILPQIQILGGKKSTELKVTARGTTEMIILVNVFYSLMYAFSSPLH